MKEDEKVPEAKKPEAAISGPEKSAAGMDPTTTTTTTTATDKNVSAAVDPSEPVQPHDHTGKIITKQHTNLFQHLDRHIRLHQSCSFSQILKMEKYRAVVGALLQDRGRMFKRL